MSIGDIRLYTSVFIFAAGTVIIILERIFPYNKGQKFFREGFFNDFILYNFVQSFILGYIISYIIEIINNSIQLSHLGLISSFPVWSQVVFFVITHDFYIYWFHRYQHRSKIFWRIHEAHHSTPQVDWLSGARSHAMEILINQTIEFAPIILLGAAPEVAVYKGAISAVWGMYIHSNIDVHSGRMQYVINGPEMHRWHHSLDPDSLNKNFSTKLAIWDWLFGTSYFPAGKKAENFGLGSKNFPGNYFSQFVFAFRKFSK